MKTIEVIKEGLIKINNTNQNVVHALTERDF